MRNIILYLLITTVILGGYKPRALKKVALLKVPQPTVELPLTKTPSPTVADSLLIASDYLADAKINKEIISLIGMTADKATKKMGEASSRYWSDDYEIWHRHAYVPFDISFRYSEVTEMDYLPKKSVIEIVACEAGQIFIADKITHATFAKAKSVRQGKMANGSVTSYYFRQDGIVYEIYVDITPEEISRKAKGRMHKDCKVLVCPEEFSDHKWD